MVSRIVKNILAFALVALSPLQAIAQNSESIDDAVKVEILTGWRIDSDRHMAAIRIQLKPGWKTYWRAPGESGIPPRFGWEGSSNLKSVRFMWPTPEVFYTNGLRSIGYGGDVIIPMELTAVSSDDPKIALKGEMELGVCKDICIPVNAKFQATLANSTVPDPDIRASLKNRPATAKEAGVGAVTCSVEPISDGLRLTADIEMPSIGPKEVAVVELPDQSIWIAQAVSERNGSHLTAVAEMVPPNATPFLLNRSDVRFTIIGDRGAVDIQGCSTG